MGAQAVLSRAAFSCACAVAMLLASSAARAQADDAPVAPASASRSLHEPIRLTVGATSELMGVLSPDESALYFVSNASGTSDVMVQKPVQSGALPVSAGLGDAIWPQLAPDGKHLAYISFERDATGDVCVRALESSGPGEETCFARPDSAELQVLWWDDASLAVLSRQGLHGNFRLQRQPIAGGAPTELLARNMVGVALSPDRRWLAYIALDKTVDDVGVTFSQRTGVGIGLQRLAATGTLPAPVTYVVDLAGVTGSVAFSQRGDFLVFSQFLNDTNRDVTIDGDDNAVIFRVPVQTRDNATPIPAGARPEQLTSARWDCFYSAPARARLIASCSHEGSLDVYALPLAGAVPPEWDDARLAGEIASARDPWTRLLLASRRLTLAASPELRDSIVMQMMMWHLELGEYESTIYAAEHYLTRPEAARWGDVMSALAQHRRSDLALIRGQTSQQYIDSEQTRANALRDSAGDAPRIQQLKTLVVSEIEDDIGDKQAALRTFQTLDLAQAVDAALVAQRAERLFRLRGERVPLLETYLALAGSEHLSVAERLEYADQFVNELSRGRSRAERAKAIPEYRAQTADGSELALMLDVEAALLKLDDETQEEVRKAIFALYTQNKQPERRRALVLATLRTAAKLGNEYVQYQFVNSWVSSVRRASAERKYAEQLYDAIVLDRAYGEGRQGQKAEARGYFYGSTVATDSLEAHIGFIEARIAEGGANVSGELDRIYRDRFGKDKDDPVYVFVRAYRAARALPELLDEDRHEQAVSQIVRDLARVADALPKQAQVHQLWGFALHQRARRSGSRQAAVDASRQYSLALDLARNDERLTATLLQRLGILQASFGNYGLALRYLKERAQYPQVRPQQELGLRIAVAQCAWHMDDAVLAREQLSGALQLVRTVPELAKYKPLVNDRLGFVLSSLPASEAAAARDQYQELIGHLQRSPESTPGNRLKARLGLASNALRSGDPKLALAVLREADAIVDNTAELDPKPAVVFRRSLIGDYAYTPLQYRALIAGLRAQAATALGQPAEALAASVQRQELLAKRLAESEADEDRLELAQAHLALAKLYYEAKQWTEASGAIERGLELSDVYNKNTGSETNDVELALIRAYAELRLYGGQPDLVLTRDLFAELRRVYSVLCKYRNPRLFEQRFLFGHYLTELSMVAARP